MLRTKRLMAVLAGALALGAVVALPANPASAEECPPIPFEPTIECPGEQPPPPEEPSDAMWTTAPTVMPIAAPTSSTPIEDCWDLSPGQDIFATDTGQVAYRFVTDLHFCIERQNGLITEFLHSARTPIPNDERVVVPTLPTLLQDESDQSFSGDRELVAQYRYQITVEFRPENAPVQTYVHKLGLRLNTNPLRGLLLPDFRNTSP